MGARFRSPPPTMQDHQDAYHAELKRLAKGRTCFSCKVGPGVPCRAGCKFARACNVCGAKPGAPCQTENCRGMGVFP